MGTERERERQGDTERRRKTGKAQVEMGREIGGTEADMEGPSSAFTGVESANGSPASASWSPGDAPFSFNQVCFKP